MRGNLTYYVQKINDIVTLTEQTGEEMNPFLKHLEERLMKIRYQNSHLLNMKRLKSPLRKGRLCMKHN